MGTLGNSYPFIKPILSKQVQELTFTSIINVRPIFTQLDTDCGKRGQGFIPQANDYKELIFSTGLNALYDVSKYLNWSAIYSRLPLNSNQGFITKLWC